MRGTRGSSSQSLTLCSLPAARVAEGLVQAAGRAGSCLQGEGHHGTSARGPSRRARSQGAESGNGRGASLGNLGRGEAFPAEADGWVQGV